MKRYPTTSDYHEIIKEYYGRDDMQKLLRNRKNFVLHANTKGRVADISRRIFYGYEDSQMLRQGAMTYQSETKSTAFSIHTEDTNEDLLSDLNAAIDGDEEFDKRKGLKVRNAKQTDSGLQVELDYVKKRVGRMEMISEEEKTTSVIIEDNDENIRSVKQDYKKVDEFNAVRDFFEAWSHKRLEEDKHPLEKIDITLKRLSILDRIELFNELLSRNPGHWLLEDVQQIGIKQGENLTEMFEEYEEDDDLEDELDENLQGITDAVLTGEGLRTNAFVKKCEKNGYYFKSVKLLYDNTSEDREVEILIDFKEGHRNTVDITVEQGYVMEDGSRQRRTFDSDIEEEIRDLFRKMVLDVYREFTDLDGVVEERDQLSALSDLDGIGEGKEKLLRENGYETLDEVFDATPEELEDIDGIGETLAEKIAGQQLSD